jgi:hypothetical protein
MYQGFVAKTLDSEICPAANEAWGQPPLQPISPLNASDTELVAQSHPDGYGRVVDELSPGDPGPENHKDETLLSTS